MTHVPLTKKLWWKPQRDLALAAHTDVPVMVTAATRTERRAYARYIHDTSARQSRPFIAVSCSVNPPGHGWHAAGTHEATDEVDVVGSWFVRASGGTLFLDELEGMSQALQERLCAALCYPLETSHDLYNVRVITGAHPAWPTALERQQFSDRLYYRLNVMRVDCVDFPHDWALEGFAQMDPLAFARVADSRRSRLGARAAGDR